MKDVGDHITVFRFLKKIFTFLCKNGAFIVFEIIKSYDQAEYRSSSMKITLRSWLTLLRKLSSVYQQHLSFIYPDVCLVLLPEKMKSCYHMKLISGSRTIIVLQCFSLLFKLIQGYPWQKADTCFDSFLMNIVVKSKELYNQDFIIFLSYTRIHIASGEK